jgi:hypothetical protein
MKVFRAHVLAHLGKYKTSKLNISNPGYYRGKIYPHILPEIDKSRNILQPYNGQLNTSKYLSKIKLHTNFSHLNSSQAMCINFFYPLIVDNKLELITSILGIKGKVDYASVAFEKESIVEKSNERKTNFDFYLKINSGSQNETQIFFEIKYTEDGFGKVKNDQGHIDKYNRTYEAALVKSTWIEDSFKEMTNFFKHYQIMRNLLAIDDKSYVVFIYPKDNDAVSKAAEEAKKEIVTSAGRKHLITINWETLVDRLLKTKALDKGLERYYDMDFREKYLQY